jgi:thioredoxin reductase
MHGRCSLIHFSPRDVESFEIGIVGSGPAGLSAAIWSARYGHQVVVVDSGDPRNWETRGVNGYLGLPQVRPAELRGKGREELRQYGVTLLDNTVLRAESAADDTVTLHLQGGDTLRVQRVLLAIGLRDVWPDIDGLEQVYGANAHVCPDCDGYDTRGKRVVVVGHGKRAVSMALALTTWTDDVLICTHGRPTDLDDAEELQEKLEHCGIAVREERVERLEPSGSRISSLVLEGGERLDVDKLFFTIAQYPADDLGVQLGCERDRGGHIVVSEHFSTSVRNVFAAGDITPGPQLAIRAAASGAVAAMAMHKSLLPEHRRL